MNEGDDPEMKQIAEQERDNTIRMFKKTVDEEKAWAKYLFKNGSMIGLNDKLLGQYVEWIANRRMKAIGLKQSMISLPVIIHYLGHNIDLIKRTTSCTSRD